MKTTSNNSSVRRVINILAIVVLVFCAGPTVRAAAQPRPRSPAAVTPQTIIQQMINQVNTSTVMSYEEKLSGSQPATIGGSSYTMATRYSKTTEPIQKATQFVYEHLQALGLQVSYFDYNLPNTGTRRNVIAVQPGVTTPGCIYVAGAHVDDTSESGSRSTFAPGADDNASGTVAVLIAADILSQYTFDCTVRYVIFTGEEQGLYGSAAYAAQVNTLNEDMRGVLNLDMIAYDADGVPIVTLHARNSSSADQAIANMFAGVVSAYSINLTPTIVRDTSNNWDSDHSSFWDEGIPAILAIEDESDADFNPNWHSINDNITNINSTYFTNFVKASVGTMAHLAGVKWVQGSIHLYLPLIKK
jgi:hypothetical protein